MGRSVTCQHRLQAPAAASYFHVMQLLRDSFHVRRPRVATERHVSQCKLCRFVVSTCLILASLYTSSLALSSFHDASRCISCCLPLFSFLPFSRLPGRPVTTSSPAPPGISGAGTAMGNVAEVFEAIARPCPKRAPSGRVMSISSAVSCVPVETSA